MTTLPGRRRPHTEPGEMSWIALPVGARYGIVGEVMRAGSWCRHNAGPGTPRDVFFSCPEAPSDAAPVRKAWCHLLHCSAECVPAKVNRRCRSMQRVAPENSSRA